MTYIGNGFSVNMLSKDATIRIENITKQEFIQAGETAESCIGHEDIANLFGLKYNRCNIRLYRGDILYLVTPAKRSKTDGYKFIPEMEGYVYKRIQVIE